MWVVMEEKEEV